MKQKRGRLKGKKLKNQICVHHINGNHYDNRPENIIIVTRSEHSKIHWNQGDIRNGRSKTE